MRHGVFAVRVAYVAMLSTASLRGMTRSSRCVRHYRLRHGSVAPGSTRRRSRKSGTISASVAIGPSPLPAIRRSALLRFDAVNNRPTRFQRSGPDATAIKRGEAGCRHPVLQPVSIRRESPPPGPSAWALPRRAPDMLRASGIVEAQLRFSRHAPRMSMILVNQPIGLCRDDCGIRCRQTVRQKITSVLCTTDQRWWFT